MKNIDLFKSNTKGQFIDSNDFFFQWKSKFYDNLESYLDLSYLFQDNRSDFVSIWGRQSFTFLSSSNRRCYIWNFTFEHGELWVITAKEKGTSYEWNPYNEDKFKTEVVDFFNKTIKELKELN